MENEKFNGSVWDEDNSFIYQTELESENLKIIYKWETFLGIRWEEEISLTDKRKNVNIGYNSVRELKDYIEKNA